MEELFLVVTFLMFLLFGRPLVNLLQTGLDIMLDPEKFDDDEKESDKE